MNRVSLGPTRRGQTRQRATSLADHYCFFFWWFAFLVVISVEKETLGVAPPAIDDNNSSVSLNLQNPPGFV
jgi:hypothetical protein